MLQLEQKCYYLLTSDELDTLIQTHFGKPDYCSIAAYEWSNDTEHSNTVHASEVAVQGSYGHQEIQDFLAEGKKWKSSPHWSTLLAELARRGEVPEGNYLITIGW